MAFETREQVLEKMLSRKKPLCPHCGKEMNIWETPPINFADGLGWGTPFLFICFNDDCPLYQKGWDHMKETYAHTASYRCMCYPDGKKFELIPEVAVIPEGAMRIPPLIRSFSEGAEEVSEEGIELPELEKYFSEPGDINKERDQDVEEWLQILQKK